MKSRKPARTKVASRTVDLGDKILVISIFRVCKYKECGPDLWSTRLSWEISILLKNCDGVELARLNHTSGTTTYNSRRVPDPDSRRGLKNPSPKKIQEFLAPYRLQRNTPRVVRVLDYMRTH